MVLTFLDCPVCQKQVYTRCAVWDCIRQRTSREIDRCLRHLSNVIYTRYFSF